MKIHLGFDEELIERYEKRGASLIFNIAWEHNGTYYPDEDWIDFGGVIMSWWLITTRKLGKDIEEGKFSFMDGPYSIDVKYYREQNRVELVPNGLDVVWNVSLEELEEALISAAQKICEKLTQVNAGFKHVTTLQKGIEMLRTISN